VLQKVYHTSSSPWSSLVPHRYFRTCQSQNVDSCKVLECVFRENVDRERKSLFTCIWNYDHPLGVNDTSGEGYGSVSADELRKITNKKKKQEFKDEKELLEKKHQGISQCNRNPQDVHKVNSKNKRSMAQVIRLLPDIVQRWKWSKIYNLSLNKSNGKNCCTDDFAVIEQQVLGWKMVLLWPTLACTMQVVCKTASEYWSQCHCRFGAIGWIDKWKLKRNSRIWCDVFKKRRENIPLEVLLFIQWWVINKPKRITAEDSASMQHASVHNEFVCSW